MKLDKAEDTVEVDRFSDQLMRVKVIVGNISFNIFSIHAPHLGRTAQEKKELWNKLEDKVARVPHDGLIVGGEVKTHDGSDRVGFEEVMRLYGFGESTMKGMLCRKYAKITS